MKKLLVPALICLAMLVGNWLTGAAAASVQDSAIEDIFFDASFGSGGVVITDIAGSEDQANAVALQPDGKIVVAGRSGRWSVARYNPNGTLDTTFDGDGKVLLALIGANGGAQEVFVLPDGKIIVAGTAESSGGGFAVAKLNADGSLDTTFGTNGTAVTSFGTSITASGNAGILQPDGKILVIGHLIYGSTTNVEDWAAARFNADGTLDTTFGSGGKAILNIRNSDEAFGAKLQTDGKIVIAGFSAPDNGTGNLTLARLNGDGSFDTTFGNGGKVISPFANNFATSVAILPDGKILAAGSVFTGNKDDFTAERYNADGSLDTTFGTNGRVVSVLSSSSNRANDVVLQPDGKFILSGYSVVGGRQHFALARYTANGALDPTFSGDGIQNSIIRFTSAIQQTVVQPDGKILSVGGTTAVPGSGSTNDFALVRYDTDGSGPSPTGTPTPTPATPTPTPTPGGTLDATFNANGKQIFNFGTSEARANAMRLQTDGKIVLGGAATVAGSGVQQFALARLNQSGALDTTFGTGGKTQATYNSASVINSIALQPDGKIVAAGATVMTNNIAGIARFTASGALDTAFGTNGFVTVQPIGGNTPVSEARDVVVQADGKIVVVGRAYNAVGGSTDGFFVLRLNADGSRDTAFGANGIILIDFTGNYELATAVALQADGKIVAAGINSGGSGQALVLARLNQNGTYDASFNGNGKLVTTLAVSDNARLVIQPDGKIIAGGNGNQVFVAHRFNADGSRDNLFSATINTNGANFSSSYIYSLALQADGKLIGAGGNTDTFVFRTQPNGALDGSFGTNGRLILDVSGVGSSDAANAVAIQPDGKIVTGGFIYSNSNAVINFAVVRLYPGGGNFTVQKPVADFDGDGKSDLSVFRPANGFWYIRQANNNFSSVQFGQEGDQLAPADYDGDGKTDIAVWRAGAFAYFYILNSADNTFRAAQFGQTGDNPSAVGDWDGDGKADLAVYRSASASGGQSFFYYRPSSQTAVDFVPVQWGTSGDKAMRGDFDGDGKADAAVFRPSNNIWYMRQSSNNQARYEQWGASGDKFTGGDFDGDGRTDLVVFRSGVWYIKQSSTNQPVYRNWGADSDQLAPGDYDGDGRTDVAVYRSGVYYIQNSSNAQNIYQYFGSTGDLPIAAAFVQ